MLLSSLLEIPRSHTRGYLILGFGLVKHVYQCAFGQICGPFGITSIEEIDSNSLIQTY